MIRIDHVTFSYGGENENAGGVHDINLTVEDGQCVVLCGESGSGKTTITRLINGLIPHYYEGKMNGEVWVNGAKVSEQPLYDTAKTVGSVFQNPRSQFFNVDTTSEITFGCENLGQPEQSIRERLDKTIRDFRLEKYIPMYFMVEDSWASFAASFGEEYADRVMAVMPMWSIILVIAGIFIFAILGGLLGKALLKKHFAKAGIV